MTDEQSAADSFIDRRLGSIISNPGKDAATCSAVPGRRGPVDLAIPVYKNAPALKRCLSALLPTLSNGDRVVILDDASNDPEIARLVEDFVVQWPRCQLIVHEFNQGFVATANEAIRSTHRDLVLLNSDTRVQQHWLEHLQDALYANSRAGIVCPISDQASILSVLPGDDIDSVGRAARSSCEQPLLPTAVGFCMLISRKLLDQTESFNPEFAPGYGEENDLSMRALKLGFDIQVADRAVVFHSGAGSFESAQSRRLQSKHQAILDGMWPEYRNLVQSWWRENPLREKTERLARGDDSRTSVLHVLHRQYHIGGTERITRGLIHALSENFYQALTYPGQSANPWCDFEARPSDLCRELMLNNRWMEPSTRLAGHGADLSCTHSEQALGRVIRGMSADIVHFHHLLHWDSLLLPQLATRLGARVVISVHDFFFNCPIHNQLEYFQGQPCGRRQLSCDDRCMTCLRGYSAQQPVPGGAEAYAAARQQVLGKVLGLADAIVVPSQFIRGKILQAFDLPHRDRLHVIPHGTELPEELPAWKPEEALQIGYFGGDQVLKGSQLIVQLARRLEQAGVQFRIYGRVKGFRPDQLPENITLCGFYNPGEVGQAMRAIDVALIPSYYEESFSLIVSECWAHGVPVVTSDRGALAERVVDGVNGWRVQGMEVSDWLEATQKIMQPGRLESMRARIRTQKVHSLNDNADAYTALYHSMLSQAPPEPKPVTRPSPPSAFELQLRRFRPRHIRRDAHWYRPAAHGVAKGSRCLGIARDDWGTANYRIRLPLLDLATAGASPDPLFHEVKSSGFSVEDVLDLEPITQVLVQPFLSDQGLAMMERLCRRPGLDVTLVIDDLWTGIPEDNPVLGLMPPDISSRLTYAASLCHQVVLTTPHLQRLLGLDHPTTRIIENALPEQPWQQLAVKQTEKPSARPRVGWAGAPQHGCDLEFLEPVLRRTCDRVDWVFLGMCPEALQKYVKEVQPMVPFSRYPRALAGAGLDLAIAPLADHAFNRCKSHLKVLEYGALGIPVIASDLNPYQHCPVTRIEGNDPDTWVNAIRDGVQEPQELRRLGVRLQQWVQENHLLKHRRTEWCEVLGMSDHAT